MTDFSNDRIKNWLKNNFVFFGPGLILAVTAAGEAGVTEAIEIGAHHGISLIWVVIIALLFKYAFTSQVARYTLATGKTIFEGFVDIPGVKNWGGWFIIFSFLIDSMTVGVIIIFAATFFEYMLPGIYSKVVLGFFITICSFLILRTHIYHYFESIMSLLIIILGLLMAAILLGFFMLSDIEEGFIPNIPENSETAMLSIMGAIGSGLSLMLYSVWLGNKIARKDIKNEVGNTEESRKKFFNKYIRSVKIDIVIGFVFVALITVGFMELGYVGHLASMLPQHTHLTIDALMVEMIYTFNRFPYGAYLAMAILALVFFCASVAGIEARMIAMTKVIEKICLNNKKHIRPHNIHLLCMFLFMLVIAAVILYNDPLVTAQTISGTCALLFGICGFILIYMNTKLPEYARGSRLHTAIMTFGGLLSIYAALRIEQEFLTHGLPLIEKMMLITVIFYFFCRSSIYKKLIRGTADLTDKFWLVLIFGLISVYGTYGGIPIEGAGGSYIINFRDLGAAAAGAVGGPVLGLMAALIGGIYRLNLGGITAIPCFLGTIFAGLSTPIAVRIWKGKFTIIRAFFIAFVYEAAHLLVILPIYSFITGALSMDMVLDIIRITFLPMMITNMAGLAAFALFVPEYERLRECLIRFKLKKFKHDFLKVTPEFIKDLFIKKPVKIENSMNSLQNIISEESFGNGMQFAETPLNETPLSETSVSENSEFDDSDSGKTVVDIEMNGGVKHE